MSEDNLNEPVGSRPVMVRTGDSVRPGVSGALLLSSGPNVWPGYFMEELYLDQAEIPSGSSLVSHAVLSVVSCDPGSRVFWRESGREQSRVIHPGDIFMRSHEEFDGFRWNKSLFVRLLGIQHQTLANLDPEAAPGSEYGFTSTNAEPDGFIPSLLEKLALDVQRGSPIGGLYGETLCTALALYGLRSRGQHPVRRCEYKGTLPAPTLLRVVDYIFANLAHDLTISELACVAGHTPNSFRKLFERSVHRAVHQFVMDARIEVAKTLLKQRGADLTTVAATVGFCHQSHFCDIFRRRVGLSPGRFRASTGAGIPNVLVASR
jgi:AraC family transcriptional regulator